MLVSSIVMPKIPRWKAQVLARNLGFIQMVILWRAAIWSVSHHMLPNLVAPDLGSGDAQEWEASKQSHTEALVAWNKWKNAIRERNKKEDYVEALSAWETERNIAKVEKRGPSWENQSGRRGILRNCCPGQRNMQRKTTMVRMMTMVTTMRMIWIR
jgi:hypothetical protein